MKNDLKVSMPDAIMARMAGAGSPEGSRAEGVRIAQEMLAELCRYHRPRILELSTTDHPGLTS